MFLLNGFAYTMQTNNVYLADRLSAKIPSFECMFIYTDHLQATFPLRLVIRSRWGAPLPTCTTDVAVGVDKLEQNVNTCHGINNENCVHCSNGLPFITNHDKTSLIVGFNLVYILSFTNSAVTF